MSNPTQAFPKPWGRYQPLFTAAIATTGLINLIAPVLASTQAGVTITNTATATYVSPETGATLESTSNTVTVTVAEVAGIAVVPKSVENLSAPGGQVLPNHELFYAFEVTNTGNADTIFGLPLINTLDPNIGAATFGHADGGSPVTQVQVSYDGGVTYSNVDVSGLTSAIAAGDSILVRVPVTVNSNAPSGASISIDLGATPTIGDQNIPYISSGGDLYTVDADGATAPINGQVEASTSQEILVGAKPQVFATILKSHTAYNDNGTLSILQDDLLTYGLSLRVEGSPPAGSPGLIPANLVGTDITLNSATASRVLVSDAIPAGTVLAAAPIAPAGWTVVYSTDDPRVTGQPANAVAWTTWNSPTLSTVKRVGFVFSGSVAAGSTTTGFSFQVSTTTVAATGQTIENIAQLFGETAGGTPGTLVYDESGDQNPSNFNDNGTPGSNLPTNGIANSATQGTDPNSSDSNTANDNQGLGAGGEVNVFLLLPPGAVLNGPQGDAAAVGPTGSNDDFTNAEVVPTDSTPGATLAIPQTVTFTNTVNNPGTASLTDVLLVPRDIASVAGIDNADLPNGTTVEVVYGTTNATYVYAATTGTFTFTGGSGIGPVRISSLPAGTSVDYQVKVTLPAGTPLSTDETAGVLNGGYPVPMVAFSDTGVVNGLPDGGESQNLTIDRLYVGYLKMIKEARILDGSGAELAGFSTAPPANLIVPGNILEYRISYTNISEESSGSGNIILDAAQVVITENGTNLGGNNWALDNDNFDGDSNSATGIDTSNVQGTARASQGTVTFSPGGDRSGPDQTTDVTEYSHSAGTVSPQQTGTFQFWRRIN